jgi:hypothetical protein
LILLECEFFARRVVLLVETIEKVIASILRCCSMASGHDV